MEERIDQRDKYVLNVLTNPVSTLDIEFRVDRIVGYSGEVYCILIPYKTARVDMMRLDLSVGAMNWQTRYERDSKGILQCGIGIWDYEKSEWVWKYSNGKPSQFESEKGEYSDAFKRAGFMWGIGRDLYDFPKIRIIMNEKEYSEKDNKYKQTGYFNPNDWKWDISDDYTRIVAKDKHNQVRFNSEPYQK